MRLKLSNHLMLIFCVLVSKVVARGSMFGEKYWFDTSNLQVAWKWKNWYSHYFEWFCVNRFPAISMLDQVNYPWCFFVPFIQHAAQKWIVNFFCVPCINNFNIKKSFLFICLPSWSNVTKRSVNWNVLEMWKKKRFILLAVGRICSSSVC